MIFYNLFLHMLYVSAVSTKLEEQGSVLLYLHVGDEMH